MSQQEHGVNIVSRYRPEQYHGDSGYTRGGGESSNQGKARGPDGGGIAITVEMLSELLRMEFLDREEDEEEKEEKKENLKQSERVASKTQERIFRKFSKFLIDKDKEVIKAVVKGWYNAHIADNTRKRKNKSSKYYSKLGEELKVLNSSLSEPRFGYGTITKVMSALGVLLIYLVVGATIFSRFERGQEMDVLADRIQHVADAANISPVCEAKLRHVMESEGLLNDYRYWDWPSSLFFCVTVISTIGYGATAPQTQEGRWFCIAYAFFGIPLFSFALSKINSIILGIFTKLWYCVYPPDSSTSWLKYSLFVFPIIILCVLLLGGIVFVEEEGWNYGDSIYFSAITLSSIGFGDIVPESTTAQMTTTIYVMLFMGCMSGFFFHFEEAYAYLFSQLCAFLEKKIKPCAIKTTKSPDEHVTQKSPASVLMKDMKKDNFADVKVAIP
mmetsp:Transcript_26096/g.41993  ORF Transcript_26096/g.41993 Transcript_26096/m.41993 type:complete len:443 (-) Transcript_26096:54-1382(-)|eukprot:jgi/Bigna1/84347/fgenesh1_pg.131_\